MRSSLDILFLYLFISHSKISCISAVKANGSAGVHVIKVQELQSLESRKALDLYHLFPQTSLLTKLVLNSQNVEIVDYL